MSRASIGGPMAFKPKSNSEGRLSREFLEAKKKNRHENSKATIDTDGWILPEETDTLPDIPEPGHSFLKIYGLSFVICWFSIFILSRLNLFPSVVINQSLASIFGVIALIFGIPLILTLLLWWLIRKTSNSPPDLSQK